jgi:hypothetical protein
MQINKISIINLILSIAELSIFFIGVEFFSGGICDYWKCQTIYVSIWVMLVMIHVFINFILICEMEKK